MFVCYACFRGTGGVTEYSVDEKLIHIPGLLSQGTLDETVDDLKKLIKIVRTPALEGIAADKLKLVRVNILDDPAAEFRPVSLSLHHLVIVRPLRATELLRYVFPGPTELGKIHIMIELAELMASMVNA
ncbi:hypothetical protein BGZ82_003228 [Podila clonocystis]|nr:hypothetical protein BGZ82_003228 [Podila clonocystis]